jgi:hypothetical protein
MITRRCTQRQFLMRPDEQTNKAFEYCLAVAAERHGIELLFTIAMSNHHHTGIFDPNGRYPEFLEYFHKLFAKCQNALRGRWENFWSSEQTSVVQLVSDDDVVSKLVYAVTNPVKGHLVERAVDWPGVSSYAANRTGSDKLVRRPEHFFRAEGLMPERVTLRFRRPRSFAKLRQDEWSELLAGKVQAIEFRAAEERRRTGTRCLGPRGVLTQRWYVRPASSEPRRTMNPRVAAKSTWRRIEALQRNKRFLAAYRAARALLVAGYNYALFPTGTYWMARFMRVVCGVEPVEVLALTG